jgi:ABC-type antimicrobial peptide transport system permease subunit
MLYRVRATDPIVIGSVTLILTAVALVAIVIPARRAARVDLLAALRE